jgi:hypothetical protein
LEAERSEHNALIQKEVYDTVSRPRDKQILKARPVYRIKRDSHGTILKFKVRVVVKGYLQKYGVSYFVVFAPVSAVDGIRIIIATATQRDWGIRQFDVSTAYLNALIEEEIYVEPPPGFEEPDKKVWLLNKSLYGAKQSAKNWGDFLATVLRSQIHVLGYYPLAQPTFDSCTRLCFGYYTIERLPGGLSRHSEALISSANLDDSANIVNCRHRDNALTGVTFRREQYSSRFSTQPRGRVRFSPMFRS